MYNTWERKNASFDNGSVNRSGSCSSLGLCWINTHQDYTCDTKWCYLGAMCLVLRRHIVPMAILMYNWLSSWTLSTHFGLETCMGITVCISTVTDIRDSTCFRAVNNKIYSALVVLRAISVCKELRQKHWTVDVCDNHSSSRQDITRIISLLSVNLQKIMCLHSILTPSKHLGYRLCTHVLCGPNTCLVVH